MYYQDGQHWGQVLLEQEPSNLSQTHHPTRNLLYVNCIYRSVYTIGLPSSTYALIACRYFTLMVQILWCCRITFSLSEVFFQHRNNVGKLPQNWSRNIIKVMSNYKWKIFLYTWEVLIEYLVSEITIMAAVVLILNKLETHSSEYIPPNSTSSCILAQVSVLVSRFSGREKQWTILLKTVSSSHPTHSLYIFWVSVYLKHTHTYFNF